MRTLLALVSVALIAQDSKPEPSPWSGFKTGSWVVLETTETSDGKSSKERHRFKVEIQPGGEIVCIVSKEEDKPAIFFEERPVKPGADPGAPPLKAEKPKAETLDVGGRKVESERVRYSFTDNDRNIKEDVALWRAKALKVPFREWNSSEVTVMPGRTIHSDEAGLALDPQVVRYERTFVQGAFRSVHRFRIAELEQVLKLGGREITCSVEEGVIEENSPSGETKVTFRRWLSDAVPGRVAKSELRGVVHGLKVERLRHVVSFEVLK